MSLSKLSSTSGGSSKIAFNGQNVFSEKQHPLLLPTVLDIIFPYLTFAEVKSSRLVCKAWGEAGIPFIGRKKLRPVHFSRVTHKDFLALIKEFEAEDPSKPHPKLKLFQGFRLTWEEVINMSYCNFMPSFKPNELAIYGRNISDPSTSLISLLQPVLTTLTHFSLDIILDSSYSCRSYTDLLNNFVQLQSMTLKALRLQISVKEEYQFTHKEMDDIYRAFEVVFQSQSLTLENLELKFECGVSVYKYNAQFEGIKFPVFPSIQHLSLSLDITEEPANENLSIFDPFDFCVKFPQLVQLDILDWTFFTMDEKDIILERGHPLMKKINLSANENSFCFGKDENIDIFENLHESFPYIEELRIEETPLLYLQLGGIEISWVDTLRVLECFGTRLDFNFGHLKNLEYLQYKLVEFDFETEEFQITPFIEMLLDHHRQLPHLKLFHLISDHNLPSPEKMNQILEALPEEFRAIFKFTL